MLEEGDDAPQFELPAVDEGEHETVALEEYLDKNVIILAFYPGDFNPACADGETGLDGLDLFTMQKDVSILAVSGDSLFSHEAFADEYDLHVPLLADVHGDVAAAYGVAADADTHQTRRAAFVIDHTGQVEYAWAADAVDDLPDVDELRAAVEGVGSDETARSRYRVGNARYLEGRRAFTSAMKAYEDREWMMARGDFTRACEEFDTAREEFNTAIRFAETDEDETYYERAERKSEALWRAADWLGDSANAFASGEGAEAERLRQDAEAPLETARDIHEPPDPDDFPPEEDPAAQSEDTEEDASLLPEDDDEERDTSLDLDETADDESQDETTADEASPAAGESWGDDTPGTTATDDTPETTESADTSTQTGREEETATADADSGDEKQEAASIDDDELEEIAAELEEQTKAAQARADEADDGDDSVISDEIAVEDGEPEDAATDGHDTTSEEHVEDELDEDDIELDLTDPTEGEDDEDEDEEDEDDLEDISDEDLGGGGDHGVPDSL